MIVFQRPSHSFITARCHFNNVMRWHVIAFREVVDAGNSCVKERKAWTITTEKLSFYDSREFIGSFTEQRRKRKDF